MHQESCLCCVTLSESLSLSGPLSKEEAGIADLQTHFHSASLRFCVGEIHHSHHSHPQGPRISGSLQPVRTGEHSLPVLYAGCLSPLLSPRGVGQARWSLNATTCAP